MCAISVPGGGLCGACIQNPGVIARTTAALRYQDDARELVHGYKFNRDLVAGAVLAQALLEKVSTHTASSIVVPIPSTLHRLRHRGFDPATEIVRYLVRHRPDTAMATLLKRHDRKAPQSSMPSRTNRRRNVHGVFHVKPHDFEERAVILVDDVLTTGATAQAAAPALMNTGSNKVELWVCARTP